MSWADAGIPGSPTHAMFGCLCQYSTALLQECALANYVTCYPLSIARCALLLLAMLSLAGIKWQQEYGKRAAPYFSQPALCFGRNAVILTLLLAVVLVAVLYVHQAGMCFAQKCVNLCLC